MGQRVRSAYVDVVERKALDENRYQVTIAANEGVRQPPDLDFDGMATENYERNPVVMWRTTWSGARRPAACQWGGRFGWTRRPTAGWSRTSSFSQTTLSRSG